MSVCPAECQLTETDHRGGHMYPVYVQVADPGENCKIIVKTTSDAMLTGCGIMTKFYDPLSSPCTRLMVTPTFMIEKCCGWDECAAAGIPGLPPTDPEPNKPGKEKPSITDWEPFGQKYLRYPDKPEILSDEVFWPVKTNMRRWKALGWMNATTDGLKMGIQELLDVNVGTEEQMSHTQTDTEEYEFQGLSFDPHSWAAWSPYLICTDGS